jgi:hypothetical protein
LRRYSRATSRPPEAPSTQAFTLIAGGDAGWPSDDAPPILGRPARSYHQFADYALASPQLLF